MTKSHATPIKNPAEVGGKDTLSEAALRQEAARQMGQVRTERKRAAVRENGKKGGRPPGSKTSEAAKARMREVQRRRRAREQANTVETGTVEAGSEN